jgi:hypothetical protein
VLVSLCYRLIRWLLEFVVLRVRSEESKELRIVGTCTRAARITVTPSDR